MHYDHLKASWTEIGWWDLMKIRRQPSWTPSWISQRATGGFSGTLDMVIYVPMGTFPEEISLLWILSGFKARLHAPGLSILIEYYRSKHCLLIRPTFLWHHYKTDSHHIAFLSLLTPRVLPWCSGVAIIIQWYWIFQEPLVATWQTAQSITWLTK